MMYVKQKNCSPKYSNLFDTIFEAPFQYYAGRDAHKNIPAVNILEEEETYVIELAVPGLEKDDFKLHLEKNSLTVSTKTADAKKEEVTQEKTSKYSRKEFDYSRFQRTFTLSNIVDKQKIKANYEAGILRIHLPKKEEATIKREISIS